MSSKESRFRERANGLEDARLDVEPFIFCEGIAGLSPKPINLSFQHIGVSVTGFRRRTRLNFVGYGPGKLGLAHPVDDLGLEPEIVGHVAHLVALALSLSPSPRFLDGSQVLLGVHRLASEIAIKGLV